MGSMRETTPASPAGPAGPVGPVDSDTVGHLGEDSVLAALREVIEAHNASAAAASGIPGGLRLGPGDDAAVFHLHQPGLVATTDTMSQNQDFRLGWWDDPLQAARAVGIKAAAQNLSDISAMGARPTALLVSLTLPPQTRLDWAVGIMGGIAEQSTVPGAEGCVIAGGDLGSGELVAVTITALGVPVAREALLRSGARGGDVLAVCGPLGRAAAGLDILEGHLESAARDEELLDLCLAAQRRPSPDLTAGPRAAAAGATSGLDVSDGLLRDADRLARASGVRIDLDEQRIEEEAALLSHLDPGRARQWVLGGGEDYALLATFPAGTHLPEGFRPIGAVRDHPDDPGVWVEGVSSPGWDSLR
ncbi:thiamine-phosphate kinase [Nesterenkonia suensis]